MIPLTLQLKNFLSYGPELQTVDFSSYQLICLSGKNGHGKSALLDAITWALWGQARKKSGTSKADDGLLRLGQTQMMVSLDFECNSQTYRVRREYARTYGKPYAALDFAIINQDGSTVSLTDKTIRATQDKIERTLNLTFDSFVNSAFLRQGQANEFSQKSPKDRKDILANILGLDEYEQIRRLAMEKTKITQAEKKQAESFQEQRHQELEKNNEIIGNIKIINEQIAALNTQETELHKQQVELEKKRTAHAHATKEQEMILFKRQQLEQQHAKDSATIIKIRDTWRSIHKRQLHLPDHAKLDAEKNQLTQSVRKQQEALQLYLKLKEQALGHKEMLQKLEQTLHTQYAQTLNAKKIDLERCLFAKKSTEKAIADLISALEKNKSEQTQITQQQELIVQKLGTAITPESRGIHEQQFEKRKAFYQDMITQGNWIKQELTALEQKQKLTHDTENPSCPLCEQNLSASRRKFLHNTFAKSEESLRHRLKRIGSIISKLKTILIEQHAEIETLKKYQELELARHKLSTEHQAHEKAYAEQMQELTKITAQEAQELTLLTTLEKDQQAQVTSNEDHQKITLQLNAVIKLGKELNYQPKEHELVTKQLQDIELQLTEYNAVRDQLALQADRLTTFSTLCMQLKELRIEIKKLTHELDAYNHLAKNAQDLQLLEAGIVEQMKANLKNKELLLQEKGSLENQQNKLLQLEKEYQEQQVALKKMDTVISDYQSIATATSKDGIQALLIEDAIPEIEQEANNLLSKLTDNQAQIFIESLRDLKKGGTKETLDITISDAMGIRPYEMFSGGEAFRIDFALRIAISKLLARRAGTSLQTLIIDEGFGSQDDEGLSHIMDAIYKIQDDFLKVIIVSHLPAMKEQFPVHFCIEKGANGSVVNVIEQG